MIYTRDHLGKLIKLFKKHGEYHPKRHGSWYVLRVQSHTLVLDTWNSMIRAYSGSVFPVPSSDGVVYIFRDKDDSHVDSVVISIDFGTFKLNHMFSYWYVSLADIYGGK